MQRAKIVFHFSFVAYEKSKRKDHTPEDKQSWPTKARPGRKAGSKFRVKSKFTSYRQPKFARTVGQSRQGGDEESLKKGKKVSWQNSLKEGQKKRRRIGTTICGSIGGNQKGQRKTRKELEDCLDAWVRCCDEAEAAQEHKSFVEEELKHCFGRYNATWESSQQKNIAVVREQQQHLEADLKGHLDLVKEHGWETDKAEMLSLWAATKISMKKTPSMFVNA